MKLDPYETLGVARDATEPEIRKAYRDKAKTAHPNAGGDREEWDGVSRALAVLTDPKARSTYDKTGKIDEPEVDNDRAAALMIVHNHLLSMVSKYVSGGFQRADDPRYLNLPSRITDLINKEISESRDSMEMGKTVIAFERDLKARFRFRGDEALDSISRALDEQIRSSEQTMAGLEEAIKFRKIALMIVKNYDFDAKVEEPQWSEPLPWSTAPLAGHTM